MDNWFIYYIVIYGIALGFAIAPQDCGGCKTFMKRQQLLEQTIASGLDARPIHVTRFLEQCSPIAVQGTDTFADCHAACHLSDSCRAFRSISGGICDVCESLDCRVSPDPPHDQGDIFYAMEMFRQSVAKQLGIGNMLCC